MSTVVKFVPAIEELYTRQDIVPMVEDRPSSLFFPLPKAVYFLFSLLVLPVGIIPQ